MLPPLQSAPDTCPRRLLRWLLLTGSVVLLLHGCTLYRPDTQLDDELRLLHQPAGGAGRGEVVAAAAGTFTDPELRTLVAEGLAINFDLAAALARLDQAGHGVGLARSLRAPSLAYSADYVRSRSQGEEGENSWEVGLAGAYEVDLWGKFRARQKSAAESFAGTAWDAQAVQLSVAAEITLRWIDLAAARHEMTLLHAYAGRVSDALQTVRVRYRQGRASSDEVLNQEQNWHAARSDLPLAELRRETARNELAILLARPDLQSGDLATTEVPNVAPWSISAISAATVLWRPDVQAAWHRLLSSRWSESEQRANRLPTLSLGGSFSFSSPTPQGLFDTWVGRLSAGLAGPLFDLRARKLRVRQAEARVQEALHTLQATLLSAWKDTETALATQRLLWQRGAALRDRAATQSRRAVQIHERYRNGDADALTWFRAEADRYQAERRVVLWQADQLRAQVQLLRALAIVPATNPDQLTTLATSGVAR